MRAPRCPALWSAELMFARRAPAFRAAADEGHAWDRAPSSSSLFQRALALFAHGQNPASGSKALYQQPETLSLRIQAFVYRLCMK